VSLGDGLGDRTRAAGAAKPLGRLRGIYCGLFVSGTIVAAFATYHLFERHSERVVGRGLTTGTEQLRSVSANPTAGWLDSKTS
jgi:hypothetical protein